MAWGTRGAGEASAGQKGAAIKGRTWAAESSGGRQVSQQGQSADGPAWEKDRVKENEGRGRDDHH